MQLTVACGANASPQPVGLAFMSDPLVRSVFADPTVDAKLYYLHKKVLKGQKGQKGGPLSFMVRMVSESAPKAVADPLGGHRSTNLFKFKLQVDAL